MYQVQMVQVGLEIYVMFYYNGMGIENLEYAVPVDKLVDFLEKEDVSYVFKPKVLPEEDDNPDFITGIKAIDGNIIRIRR